MNKLNIVFIIYVFTHVMSGCFMGRAGLEQRVIENEKKILRLEARLKSFEVFYSEVHKALRDTGVFDKWIDPVEEELKRLKKEREERDKLELEKMRREIRGSESPKLIQRNLYQQCVDNCQKSCDQHGNYPGCKSDCSKNCPR